MALIHSHLPFLGSRNHSSFLPFSSQRTQPSLLPPHLPHSSPLHRLSASNNPCIVSRIVVLSGVYSTPTPSLPPPSSPPPSSIPYTVSFHPAPDTPLALYPPRSNSQNGSRAPTSSPCPPSSASPPHCAAAKSCAPTKYCKLGRGDGPCG